MLFYVLLVALFVLLCIVLGYTCFTDCCLVALLFAVRLIVIFYCCVFVICLLVIVLFVDCLRMV